MVLRVQRGGAERRITVEEFEAGIVRGEIVGELPLQVDGRWVRAREWPRWDTLVASPEASLHRLWTVRRVPWVTALAVGVLLQVHLWAWWAAGHGHADAVTMWTKETGAILERAEVWRLVSYGLLHGSFDHIGSNTAGLAVMGFGLERLVGHRATAVLLVAATVVGGAASAWWMPEVPSIGISGGVFGMLGAAGILGLRYLATIPPGARAAFGGATIPFALYALWMGTQAERVDNWCHLGGFVTGLAYGAVIRPGVPAHARFNRAVDGVASALLAALMVGIALGGQRLIPWTEWKGDGVLAQRPAWWEVQVGPAGLSGYGNGDRSTVVALDTVRQAEPTAADAVLDEHLERLRRIDPDAHRAEPEGPYTTLRYRAGGEDRALVLRVESRGLYTSFAGVDHRVDDTYADELVRRVLDDATWTVPDDVAEALAGEASAHGRTRMRAAAARAALGEVERAREGFAAARAAGDAASVDAAEITALAALGDPATPALIEAALAAWPDDRSVRAAAARAWFALGRADDAQRVALALWAEAASERARAGAAALYTEVGGNPAALVPAP